MVSSQGSHEEKMRFMLTQPHVMVEWLRRPGGVEQFNETAGGRGVIRIQFLRPRETPKDLLEEKLGLMLQSGPGIAQELIGMLSAQSAIKLEAITILLAPDCGDLVDPIVDPFPFFRYAGALVTQRCFEAIQSRADKPPVIILRSC